MGVLDFSPNEFANGDSLSEAARFDRALGAFTGLALGDALGMPTQDMSRADIAADYGKISGFVDAGPRQLIAAGMPAGSITDDTEQAVLLAKLLVENAGRFDADIFAERLLEWEQFMVSRGSLDLLGPSTKAALVRLSEGVPASEAGRYGTTNGAAMRITPVGIAFDSSWLFGFVDAVVASSSVTHNTTIGIAAASAVGAAVSAGVGGASIAEALEVAIAGAAEGAKRGYWVAGGSIADRLRWATSFLTGLVASQREEAVANIIGTSVSSQESVVAAFALVAVSEDPWQTLCSAASLGGDTDTIAAIAGAVLGSVHGVANFPEDSVAILNRVNTLGLGEIVSDLLALRT